MEEGSYRRVTQGSCSCAAGTVSRRCAQQIAKVYDQHLAFIALESNMFCLGMADTYLRLNDPAAKDTEIEARFFFPPASSWAANFIS